MCKHGTLKKVETRKSINGKILVETRSVDSCIAPLIQALNAVGIETVASCCGHGNRPGSIVLWDGRELTITTFEEARKLDHLFPDIWGNKHGEKRRTESGRIPRGDQNDEAQVAGQREWADKTNKEIVKRKNPHDTDILLDWFEPQELAKYIAEKIRGRLYSIL